MKSFILIFLTIAILVASLEVRSIYAAQEITLSTIYTDQQDYSYPVISNADSISYELWLGKIKKLGKTIELHNPDEAKKTIKIPLKLSSEGTYTLKFSLSDDVLNISPIHKVDIKFARKEAIAGMGTGESSSIDPGIASRYASENISADLLLDNVSDTYKFTVTNFLAPLVTRYSRNSSGGSAGAGKAFGQSYSNKSKIELQVYEQLPSFAQAAKICLNTDYFVAVVRINNESGKSCIVSQLQVLSLEQILTKLELCMQETWPWLVYSCQVGVLKEREVRYRGKRVVDSGQAIVKAYGENSRDMLGYSAQKSDSSFEIALSTTQDKLPSSIFAQNELTGLIDYNGKRLSYHWVSALSAASVANDSAKSCLSTSCNILQVKYINQAVDESGKWQTWDGWARNAGGQACGAASSVMATDFFGKLPSTYGLQSFVFRDNGEKLNNKRCAKPGAFAVTSYNSDCNQSSLVGMQNYLKQYGLHTKVYWSSSKAIGDGSLLNTIRKAIDNNHPILISYKQPIGHLLLVKGYVFANQLVVNDPYRDIQNNYQRGKYDYSGRDAIYRLQPAGFTLNFIMEVMP